MFISDEGLKEFLSSLAGSYIIIAPLLEVEGKPPILGRLTQDNLEKLELKVRPLTPFKFFIQPPSQEIFTYRVEEDSVRLNFQLEKPENFLLFGLRACDLRALERMDMVMLEEPADSFYEARRRALTLISLDCLDPSHACFCTEVGGKPYPEEGYDLNLSMVEGGFLLEVGSGRGEKLLKPYRHLLQEESPNQLEQREKQREACYQKVKNSYVGQPPRDLSNLGEEYFLEFARRCVECSGCVFTCPTCHCFYVADYGWREFGSRVRTIDSCMFESYQRVATGVNPRATLASRLRQRFLKKFVYFKERYGVYGCVGCGRCFEVCPGEIDIREVAGLKVEKVELKPLPSQDRRGA